MALSRLKTMNEETTINFTYLLGTSDFDLFLVFLMYSLPFFPQLVLKFILLLSQLDAASITCGNMHGG